jgi:hypothetical protein
MSVTRNPQTRVFFRPKAGHKYFLKSIAISVDMCLYEKAGRCDVPPHGTGVQCCSGSEEKVPITQVCVSIG